jgi:hypothetical protein
MNVSTSRTFCLGRLAPRWLGPLALLLLLPLVACAGPLAAVPSREDAPSFSRFVSPVRQQDGRLTRNARGQALSTNWSGYVVTRYETQRSYTGASGSWVVPSVAAPANHRSGASAAWVGIGGYCLDRSCRENDRSLIQLGTEQDATANGKDKYDAWYELLPAAPVTIPLAVHPGDSIAASLQRVSNATWALAMTNRTTGQSWSSSVAYQSSLASAEWIQEAPVSHFVVPLADFGSVSFDPLTVDGGANPKLTPTMAVRMVDPRGQTSNTSVPDAEGDGFRACSGTESAFTPCRPPGS